MAKSKRKTTELSPEDMAVQFLENLMAFHADDIRYLGTEAKDAVIAKSVALVALSFELPPTSADAFVNIEETSGCLVHALNELRSLRA